MQKLEVVKTIVNFVVGAGTAKIAHAVIENNVEPETRTDKVTVYAGTAALTGITVDASRKYTDAKIDEWAESWRRTKKKLDTQTPTDQK